MKPKKQPVTLTDEHRVLLSIGLLSGFVTILVTNFFGFSVVNVALLFFLVPALFVGLLSHERKSFFYTVFISRFVRFEFPTHSRVGTWHYVALLAVALFFFSSLLQLFSFWFADIAFAEGRSLNRQSRIGQAHKSFLKAVSLRTDEPFYYSELGWTQSTIVSTLMQSNDSSNSAQLAPLAEKNARLAVEMSPQNVTYWKKLADVYYNLSFFDKEAYVEKLSQTADRVQTLAPTDVVTLLTLSIYYERIGKLDTAYAIVERSTQWKPDLGQAWYRLGELAYARYQKSKDSRDKVLADEYRYKASQLEPDNEDFKKEY